MILIETKPEGPVNTEGLVRDVVVMNWEERRKSRQRLTTAGGIQIALGLPTGSTLEDGEILYMDEERYIIVQAAKEDVLCVFPGDPAEFACTAYEIGNRHLPIAICLHSVMTIFDELLESKFKKVGLRCERGHMPFEPIQRGHAHG